jgi:MipA family protein
MNCTFSVFSVARFSSLLGAALLLSPYTLHAQGTPLTDKLVGDVGGAAFLTQSVILSKDGKASVLPYGFFDYGRFFARVDTLGLKTIQLGDGYLELAGRVSQDGWRADTAALAGLSERKTSIPLGIGTFQKTPYGAFFLNAFVDANKSHGALLDATYAAQFKLGNWSFYPQLGLEYRNAKYNNYFYGVTPAESNASGHAAYNAGATTTPMLGLAADVPLGEPWVLSLQLRRKWLAAAVHNSPLVNRKTQDTGFIALSYRFK